MIDDIGNTGFRGRALYKPHFQLEQERKIILSWLELTINLIVRRYE